MKKNVWIIPVITFVCVIACNASNMSPELIIGALVGSVIVGIINYLKK